MPWQERNVVEIRTEFVIKAKEPDCNFSELCREYGISRQQGYKWLKRYEAAGVAGLHDRRRARKTQEHATDGETVLRILEIKKEKPRWGPSKIQAKLGDGAPSLRTIARILKRAGMVKSRPKRPAVQARPTSAPKSDATRVNELWTVDFKGWWQTGDKQRCEPLTVRDQASRYVLCARVLPSTKGEYVREVFEELFAKHGLPEAILSDNGSPFACTQALGGHSRVSAWWVSLGIEVRRSRPGCPQDNGAHERMHVDMRFDLEDKAADTMEAQQAACDLWRHEFNHERPHAALDNQTPGSLYHKSPRPYRTQLTCSTDDVRLRKVNRVGAFDYKGQRTTMGKPYAGFDIGIKHRTSTVCEVWFYGQQVGIFGLGDSTLPPRVIADPAAAPQTNPADTDHLVSQAA